MESNLSVTILEYILLAVFTKGMVLFAVGSILAAFCVLTDKIILPYLIGFAWSSVSFILYAVISQASKLSPLKYLNIIGLLKTENLYGSYLNFNLFGYPISRLACSWVLILLFALIGISITYLFKRYKPAKQTNSKSIFFSFQATLQSALS